MYTCIVHTRDSVLDPDPAGKEQQERFAHGCSLTISDVSDSLIFLEQIALSLSKNEQFAQQNPLFSPFFWQFFSAFPICMPKSELLPRHSWLRSSFLKSDRSDSLTVALRATGAICSLKKANCYFALSLTKNEWLAQKTKERIPNPVLPSELRLFYFPFKSSHRPGALNRPWQYSPHSLKTSQLGIHNTSTHFYKPEAKKSS